MVMPRIVVITFASFLTITPLQSAVRQHFKMMTTWGAGHDTNIGGREVPVGYEMIPEHKGLCERILAAVNNGKIPPRHIDALEQPFLPSGLKTVSWRPIARPSVGPVRPRPMPWLINDLGSIDVSSIRDCGTKPKIRGYIAYTCQFSDASVNGSYGSHFLLIRMMQINLRGKILAGGTNYFLSDRFGRISRKFRVFPDTNFSIFKFEDHDYFAGWNTEDFDFSQGNDGPRFRSPKTTLEIAETSIHSRELGGYKICVFSLAGRR